jgi:hypothetical protein
MADSDPWVDSDEPEATEVVEEESKEVIEEPKEEETKEEKKEWKPKGLPEDERWEPIELTPEAQKRFNRIYAQNQSYKRTTEETAKIAKSLAEENKRLEERLNKLEQGYSEDKKEVTIDRLKKERREALANGDDDRVLELTDEIISLKYRKPEVSEKKEVKEEVSKEEVKEEPEIDQELEKIIFDWRYEKNKNGMLLRPWAVDDHPENKMAIKMAEAIVEREDGNITIEDLLAQVEKGMNRYLGISKERTPTNVESTGGGKGKVSTSSLTPEQKRVAKLMFPNEKDPFERYAKAANTDSVEDF